MSKRINNDDFRFDVLGNVLETLRFRGSIFFCSELAAPWGMLLPSNGLPRFHISLLGDCFVGAEETDSVKIQSNEIIMLPDGKSHWIADQQGCKLTPSENAGEACELGNPLFQQGEITNRLICGLVHFDQELSHPIFDSLPEILHFPKLEPTDPIWITVTLIDAEMHRTQNQGGPIVDRLAEVLLLQLFNDYANKNEETTGFLAALHDRRVNQALMLIHREPNFDWTLTSLGERTGMSRATLIRKFVNAIGVTPMEYIMNWRIMKAYNLIKYSNMTLEQIAESVGYASARTLSKAFKRHYDCTPNELRRTL